MHPHPGVIIKTIITVSRRAITRRNYVVSRLLDRENLDVALLTSDEEV
jgi:hypothetical protein